ncbi:MAG TPA: hypothetical protein VGI87_13025 [Solirubrobacteraceae bacterium]
MADTTLDIRAEAASAAASLRQWFASGRIQAPNGAFCAWRDADSGALAFEYPEITGYALTWLAGRAAPAESEQHAAAAAAAWLIDRIGSGDRSARAGWDGGAVYNFDLGMISAGLITYGERAGASNAAELGRALAAHLAAQVEPGRGLRPLPPGESSSRPPEWSTAGYAHMTKCTQALLLGGQRDAAETVASAAIASQHPDGHFATQPGDEHVMFHPHLYTVEGLWMYSAATGDEAAFASARRATEWLWQYQLDTGALPRLVIDGEPGPEQLDVTAQAIRAAVLLGADVPGLEAAVARLLGCARADEGHGSALVYAPESQATHLNAWVTMFGAQALGVVADGPQALSWNTLV